MSLIPSPLNPIHFFGQDEPIYWKVNKFGADRGQYLRKWPLQITAQIYMNATALPVGRIIRCFDDAVVSTFTFSLVFGNTYVANPQPFLNSVNSYILVYVDVEKDTYVAPTPSATAGVTSEYFGSQIQVYEPSSLDRITIQVNIPVAMTQGIEVGIFRVDPRNRAVVTRVESIIVNSAIGLTGDQTLTALVTTVSASYQYNKDDYYTIMVRAVNSAEGFNLRFTDVGLTKPRVAMIRWVQGAAKATYIDHLQPAISTRGKEAVVSELLDGRFVLSQAAYTRQNLVMISTSNVKEYLGIPAGHTIQNFVLADFWKKQFPHNGEDIETSPGEFTRLTSEAFRNKLFDTSFVPAYTHYQLILQMGCDNLKIDDVDYIHRPENEYRFENHPHYQLSKGSVLLTERKSITRNTI